MPSLRRRPAIVQTPLTNRTFLTRSRSLGYHSKSIAREEGRGKGGGGAKVSRQELEKGKNQGSNKSVQNGYEMDAENET